MKNIQQLLVSVFVLIATFSFAQERPYLIIEDAGDKFEVFLKIDNMENIASVDLLGSYHINDERTTLSVNIDSDKVAMFKDQVALVHQLERCCSFASYTILVTNKDGEVSGYPAVNLDLSALALN